MMGFPAFHIALLQGLLVGALMLSVPMVYAFGSRVRMSGGDMMLLLPIFPVFALVTALVFWPFEANWGDTAFGPLGAVRGVIVGGAALVLGAVITQRHQLAKLNANRVLERLLAVFAVGAAWGLMWSLSGWLLTYWGISTNG